MGNDRESLGIKIVQELHRSGRATTHLVDLCMAKFLRLIAPLSEEATLPFSFSPNAKQKFQQTTLFFIIFYFYLSKKTRLDVSCESSA